MPVAGVLPETRTSCGMHKVIPTGIKTVSRLPEMSYIKCETGYISRGVPEKKRAFKQRERRSKHSNSTGMKNF